MMRSYIFYFLFVIPSLAFAQKEELKEYCDYIKKDFVDQPSFHLNYTLTVVGKADQPGKESMNFDLYKSGNKSKSVMGTAQDVIQDGKLVIVVNHLEHFITVQIDSTEGLAPGALMEDFNKLLDDARTVSKKTDQTFSTFTLYFPADHMYSSVRLVFYTRSKKISSMYSEFNPSLLEPYFSTEVLYNKVDQNWKSPVGFPGTSTYVVKKGNRYEPQVAWKSYTFHQDENSRKL